MIKTLFFIGIMEEDENRNILKYTRELLSLSSYKTIYKNKTNDIIGLSDDKINLIIFDFIPRDYNNLKLWNVEFDVIVHSFVKQGQNDYINNLFKLCKYCIINSDDERSIEIIKNIEKGIAITYGFNSKSTLTISSHTINQDTEVNLCLQRNITPIYGDKMEPFEFLIQIDSTENKLIYPLLAAATLNLVIGNGAFDNKTNSIINLDF